MYFSKGNNISAIHGKLTVIQYFHRRVGVELSMKKHRIKSVKAGITRERCFNRGGTADTSSNFVGDVEARLSSCGG